MRNYYFICLILIAGCDSLQLLPEETPTQQVMSTPFANPKQPMPKRVNYAPADHNTSCRVLLIKDRLLDANLQLPLKPFVIAISSKDPEIFHVGMNYLYITDALARQCQTDGQLAAVLANELGRMVSEREALVSDEVRQPERPLPIALPIGSNGNARDRDPIHAVELAQYEKLYPKTVRKLARPNPQFIARELLERAGFLRTDLDAALPILQNAEHFQVLENQFKGTTKQSDWKVP